VNVAGVLVGPGRDVRLVALGGQADGSADVPPAGGGITAVEGTPSQVGIAALDQYARLVPGAGGYAVVREIDDSSIPDGRNAASRLFGSLESASLAVTFAALESRMDASAAKLWNHGLPSLKRAERDCGISG
jgi:hypothetical protein